MKQEFTPPLFKAKRTDGDGWIHGMPTHDLKYIFNSDQTNSPDDYEINPSTLCMDSGLTAEWVADGIDPKIWSGDVLETESIWHRGELRKWEVIYKNGAFWVDNGEELELLFNFISDNVYTKIGSIHDKK